MDKEKLYLAQKLTEKIKSLREEVEYLDRCVGFYICYRGENFSGLRNIRQLYSEQFMGEYMDNLKNMVEQAEAEFAAL